MVIFRFGADAGRSVTAYGSAGARLSRVVRTQDDALIGCFYLEVGGVVGYHPAAMPQLFLVVAGSGWVRGEGTGRVPIEAGQAAFWHEGEGHESGTDTGMVAVVIEAESLDPARFMPRDGNATTA